MKPIAWGRPFAVVLLLVVLFATSVDHSVHIERGEKGKVMWGKPGDELMVGVFDYRVNSFSFKKTIINDFYPKTANGVFILIDVNVKSFGDYTRTIDSTLITLTDLSGDTFEHAYEGNIALEESNISTLYSKTLKPLREMRGTLCFDVPDSSTYLLHLAGLGDLGQSAIVKVGGNEK